LPPFGLDRPHHRSQALIERDEARVVQTDEDLAFAHRDAAARAAHRHACTRIRVAPIRPENRARIDVECEHVVRAVDDVQRAFVMQNLRLTRVVRAGARAHAGAPQRFQVLDGVAIEPRQRRIALIEDVAAVRDPVRRRMRRQAARVEGRRRRDSARLSLLRVERHDDDESGKHAAGHIECYAHATPRQYGGTKRGAARRPA